MQQRTKIALAVAIALSAMSALAQEQTAETMQSVEVTGSRIRQVDLATAQPIQVMTQDQIQKTGLVTVGDVINNLSAAGTPAFPKGNTLGSTREQGGQYINMRNLGSNRLLVLVDGKRWTQTVAGYTDLSTIPAAMIERIEVLKDGASSIYGSDAIAGVVNIILKKTMQGGQASVYGGRNEKGDGKKKDYALSYGAGDEKADMMFGLTYTEDGVVWAKDRAITAFNYGPGHVNAGLGTSPWGRIRQVDANGNAGGFNKILNHTGSYLGDGTGAGARDPNNYHNYAGADDDTFNSSAQMMYTSPTRLTSIFTKGSIALPYGLRFTTTAMYADRESFRQAAGYPLNSRAQNNFPVYIDKDSYYNPYGNQVAGAGNGMDLFFYRRTVELPRTAENGNRTLHIDAVLEGDFGVLGKTWNWNAGYNHSAVTGSLRTAGSLNLLNLKKALGPSHPNAAGVVQCYAPDGKAIPLAECVPFDILGGPSASTAAALQYVTSTGQTTYGSTIDSATADITGELFNLPAGAVGLAAGLEHRSVSGYDRPGQFEQSGYSTDLAGNPTSGKYTVREAYLEFNVPLLKNKPFAQLLSVYLASRHSDYSNFGNTTNSKASMMWKPVRDLLVRGTYAQGFRAPTLSDMFGGGAQTFDSYLDPCDSKYGAAAQNTAVAARCAAAGVPAGFRQVNQAGTPVPPSGAPTPTAFTSGLGNAALRPETATTKTFGLVYSPGWLSGASIALDYFDIDVKDRIAAVTAPYEIGQCYGSGVQAFCDKIKRDPASGMISSLSRGNANLGELQTRGFDLTFAYRFPRAPYGQIGVRSESTYTDTYRIKSTAASNWENDAGEFTFNRVKSNLALDWNLGNWSATLASRYYSGVKVHCWSAINNEECSNPHDPASWGTGYTRLGAMVYSDLAVGYALPWKARLLAGANNVFDRKPRIVYDANTSFANGTSSSSSVDPQLPIDRFIYVRYNQAF
jgi:iron complex outermembrane receptor protein